MKKCPFCEEEEIEDDENSCFYCVYELMDDIEREEYNNQETE